MMFGSKKVVNGVITTLLGKLQPYLDQESMKYNRILKGKIPLYREQNSIVVSSAGYKKDVLTDMKKYVVEIYYTVSSPVPEKLEDLLCDFGDCIDTCLSDNFTLGGTVSDLNISEVLFFVADEKSINIGIGQLKLEISI